MYFAIFTANVHVYFENKTKQMNPYKLIPILGLALMSGYASLAQESRSNKKKKKAEEEKVEPGLADTLLAPIPLNRQMFTDRVSSAIRGIDAKDGSLDGIVANPDPNKSKLLTQAYLVDALKLRNKIENANISHPQKITYHKALAEKLNQFKSVTNDNVDAVGYRQLMKNFEGLILAEINGTTMDFVKANATLYTLENIEVLANNKEAKAYVFKSVGLQYPEKMLMYLDKIATEPYTDEIIAAAAKSSPRSIMSYAAPNSKYGYIVRRNQDPAVKTIVNIIDKSPKTSFKVLQFMNQIKDGDITIDQVNQIVQNQDAYYKSLVKLKISGKAISEAEIDKELEVQSLVFVRRVNELHEASDAVRFKSVEGFDPQEYYFMLLGGETNEIYTSSYLGIFKRMMAKMGKESGYALLEKVRMSNFRTFIRMSAGYNTISEFLKTMTETEKTTLLRDFVAGLEKGSRSDLKDAVDVADGFGSLQDKELVEFLKSEVKDNYERVYKNKNKTLSKAEQEKGVIIYGLLASIFNSSADPDNLQDAVKEIPPINYLDIGSLSNAAGEVIVQAFFYGDKDGKDSYGFFLGNFRGNKNWKIDESNPNWTTITSVGDKKVIYYANKPLSEPDDEKAQNKLYEYLDANEIRPAVVIHRGHSYHLEGSLQGLTPDVKIVMLGSCGGFHNLANVLDKAPDAHIISTKQIGTYMVNDPIIRNMNEYLLAGKRVDWLEMWQTLGKFFANKSAREKELFSDYIPPNKNLGAIFIKAYRKMELSSQS